MQYHFESCNYWCLPLGEKGHTESLARELQSIHGKIRAQGLRDTVWLLNGVTVRVLGILGFPVEGVVEEKGAGQGGRIEGLLG